MTGLRVADFDFDLPEELIAQTPPEVRGADRMLVMDRRNGSLRDAIFGEFPALLEPGDVLVLNESRVIPARLFGRRTKVRDRQEPSGLIEVLLTGPAEGGLWRALVKPGRKVGVGERLVFSDRDGKIALEAEVLERGEFGERVLRLEAPGGDLFATLERIGHVPLPPYIRRPDADADRERYQTVFARDPGSVAAPTAGLHFTPGILATARERGVEVVRVTLHVGLGTFAPLRVEAVDQVRLHRERYTIAPEAAGAVNRAKAQGRRVVAVGTTVVRTLEAAAQAAGAGPIEPGPGATEIFIAPGFQFRIADALLTNFHLPQSSLLMLVSAFARRELVLEAYSHAVRQRYRFFSYGDCMFVR